MFCQFCGTLNSSERETCHRCGNKLLVVSGLSEPVGSTEEFLVQAQEDLEEHLREADGGPEGVIDHELLNHVRRLGDVIGELSRNHRPAQNYRAGRRS